MRVSSGTRAYDGLLGVLVVRAPADVHGGLVHDVAAADRREGRIHAHRYLLQYLSVLLDRYIGYSHIQHTLSTMTEYHHQRGIVPVGQPSSLLPRPKPCITVPASAIGSCGTLIWPRSRLELMIVR